jgi:hypothetical protein
MPADCAGGCVRLGVGRENETTARSVRDEQTYADGWIGESGLHHGVLLHLRCHG